MKTYRITDAASKLGITVAKLIWLEHSGELVPETKLCGGYRLYNEENIATAKKLLDEQKDTRR